MRFLNLRLRHFRNYQRLELALPPGPLVLVGDNAQGKSNLLEALYLLCTGRSHRSDAAADLVYRVLPPGRGEGPAAASPAEAAKGGSPRNQGFRGVPEGWPPGTAYLMAEAGRRDGRVRLEMAIGAPAPSPTRGAAPAPPAGRQVRIDGQRRRLLDLVGQVNAVLFSAQDLELIPGPPSLRRRYLDVCIGQSDRAYLAALQRYGRVLANRNHLLGRIREGCAQPQELAFWDQELVAAGSYIVTARARAVAALSAQAGEANALLTGRREELSLEYRPSPLVASGASRQEVAALLGRALEEGQAREIAATATLVGPHRDDLLFLLEGLPAAGHASRGQQRTIALALRLAEARYLEAQRGETPVLLMDDLLSELDAHRRRRALGALASAEQVLITATDRELLELEAMAGAAFFRVAWGRVEPWP